MKAKGFVIFVVLILAVTALAQVGRVGPVDPANGYPAWYQDRTGLAMEFCSPLNQAELDGGWCLLLAGDTVAPEIFPTAFFDEHFYWAGSAGINYTLPSGAASKALLTLALEGAFATGPVVAGDQIVFGRIRVSIRNLPYTGTYTVYHPYGTWTFTNQLAGDRLFFTEDIGITCPPGQFDCALASHVNPFLVASSTPGGAELPAVTGPVPGKLYVADPARLGPVTGSPVNQNFFRVEGPNGFAIQTTDFALMGRVMANTIPGRVTVDRASYATSATGNKLDVFSTAVPTTQGRLPGNPTPPAVTPILSVFDAACGVNAATGALTAPAAFTAEVPMATAGKNYWAQMQPAAIPTNVCVEDYTARDATGQVVPAFYQGTVTDDVTITEATYDPGNGGTLTVRAVSSDAVGAPTLTVSGMGDLVSGVFQLTPLAAPPAKVQVVSARSGLAELRVTTGISAGAPPSATIPVAVNDDVTTLEDTPLTIAPLTNDTLNGGPIPADGFVTITQPPRIGIATLSADQKTILYTPNPNVNGTEGIGYTVTTGGVASSTAYITIAITPVNDPPVAVDDSTSTVVNTPLTFNLLANDTDVDGAADLANVTIVNPPLGASLTVGTGGNVTFSAANSGTYTFTYRAVDVANAPSANTATVTVTVNAGENIAFTQASFRTDKRRWIVSGTDSVHANQTLTISYVDGSAAGTAIGTAIVDATGAWLLDFVGASGVLDPRNTGATSVRVSSPLGGTASATITIRR